VNDAIGGLIAGVSSNMYTRALSQKMKSPKCWYNQLFLQQLFEDLLNIILPDSSVYNKTRLKQHLWFLFIFRLWTLVFFLLSFCGIPLWVTLMTTGFAEMSVRRIPSFRPTSLLPSLLRMIPSLEFRSWAIRIFWHALSITTTWSLLSSNLTHLPMISSRAHPNEFKSHHP
jgi:hypothetical protein